MDLTPSDTRATPKRSKSIKYTFFSKSPDQLFSTESMGPDHQTKEHDVSVLSDDATMLSDVPSVYRAIQPGTVDVFF